MKRAIILSALLLSVAVSALSTSQTFALGYNFPDMTPATPNPPGECDTLNWVGTAYKCTNPARMVVGETDTVGQTSQVRVKAYFSGLTGANGLADYAKVTAAKPAIYFPGYHFCPARLSSWNSNDKIENGYFVNNTPPTTYGLTAYTVGYGSAGPSTVYGYYRGGTSASCDSSSPSFTATVGVYTGMLKPVKGVPGLLSVDILVKHRSFRPGTCNVGSAWTYCDGMYNSFGMYATQSPGATLAVSEFITNVGPCDQISGVCDPGVAAGYGVMVQNFPVAQNTNNSVTYRLRFGSDCTIPAGPGVVRAIRFYDMDYFPNASAGYEPIRVRLHKQKRDGTDARWKVTNTWSSSAVPANEWGGVVPAYSTSTSTSTAYADLMPVRNGSTLSYYFRAQRDYIYYADVLNNNDGLVFQYGLPFDSVYYNYPCTESLEPSAGFGVSRANAGDRLDAFATIENTGSSATSTPYQRDYWYSDTDDPDNPTALTSNPPRILRVNVASQVVNPGPPLNLGDRSEDPVDGNYKYICTRLYISLPEPKSSGQCIPIGKYPSLQVQGGDVRSGGAVPQGILCNVFGDGSIKGHPHGTDSKGSLGQYAVLASGSIDAFGSAGFYAANNNSNQLFFGSKRAYVSQPANDGYFYLDRSGGPGDPSPQAHCLPSLDGVYPSTGASSTIAAGATAIIDIPNGDPSVREERTFAANGSGGVSVLNVAANSSASSLILNPGKRVAIRVNGPATCDDEEKYIVRILTDVRYNGGGGSIAEAPWFSIIATSPCIRIVVADNVEQLYGLYATEGEMMTCDAGGTGFDDVDDAPLTTDACRDRLTINGAVVVGTKLHTYRTFGDGGTGNAAEVFNLDPIFSISDYIRSRETRTFRVENQLELPPRF